MTCIGFRTWIMLQIIRYVNAKKIWEDKFCKIGKQTIQKVSITFTCDNQHGYLLVFNVKMEEYNWKSKFDYAKCSCDKVLMQLAPATPIK